jgi:deazaflavin-dependent oxidoreductase (nitroreductase family)
VPIRLPRRLARVNRILTNPIQLRYAWLLPPWVVIVHRGRRSGRLYRTPVNGFVKGRTLAAVILYGERSDWVQNVLAGGGSVVRAGRTYELVEPRVVGPREVGGVAWSARLVGRLSGRLLVASLGERQPGFGPGPR